MCEIKIRNVKTGDEKVLAHIQTESWKSAFSEILTPQILDKYTNLDQVEEMYKNVIQNNFATGAILTIDDIPHCIAFWGKGRDENYSNSAELICIHSLCDKWHKGFGSMMLNYIFTEVKAANYNELVLWVFEKNTRARKFYEKHGFQLTNNCKDSFGATEVMYIKSNLT